MASTSRALKGRAKRLGMQIDEATLLTCMRLQYWEINPTTGWSATVLAILGGEVSPPNGQSPAEDPNAPVRKAQR